MLAITLAAATPDAALAHGRAAAGPDGWLPISVLAFVLICAFCISARSKARDFDVRAIGARIAALAITGVSLSASFHRLSDALFSAHMTQHLTLMMVSAPLVILGKPNIIVMRALAPSRRRIWARFWRGARKAPFAALFISPLAIWLWFIGLFAFWHLPGPYAFALQHEEAHIAEHLTLLVSACAFWAVAFGELTRLSQGGRLMFVSTAALLSALPGALISIAPRPLYSIHAGATARYGLTPLEDQQIAGLVMWIPAGFIYLAAILGLLFLWLRHAEQGRGVRGAALSAAAGIVVLSGCGDEKALERAARAAGATGDPQKGRRGHNENRLRLLPPHPGHCRRQRSCRSAARSHGTARLYRRPAAPDAREPCTVGARPAIDCAGQRDAEYGRVRGASARHRGIFIDASIAPRFSACAVAHGR